MVYREMDIHTALIASQSQVSLCPIETIDKQGVSVFSASIFIILAQSILNIVNFLSTFSATPIDGNNNMN